MWKMFFRRLKSSMARAIGQPTPETHSHLLKPGEVCIGIQRDEFAHRRRKFFELLPINSVAIIPAYKVRYSSQNIFYPWHQNNNMLYLCGFEEPNSVLVMYKTVANECKSNLFLEGNTEHSLLWSGPVCGISEAKEYFGVDEAHLFSNFTDFINSSRFKSVYFDFSKNSCLKQADFKLIKEMKAETVDSLLHSLRVIKSESEQAVMKKASEIGSQAFKETIKWSKFNRSEHMLAAKMSFEAKMWGATGLAYEPVVAGGDRANTIHYVRNDRIIEDGSLVLMDAGAKYAGYCNDITRTWPINGRFSEPQRELYNVVLKVHDFCLRVLEMRNNLEIPLSINILHASAAVNMFQEELRKLGFSPSAVEKLFPHSLGHYLGMDLHDCPSIDYSETLVPGMVITVEPGLYVPYSDEYPSKYHGIGIRIEDDILLTSTGIVNLTEQVPRNTDEIETLINSS